MNKSHIGSNVDGAAAAAAVVIVVVVCTFLFIFSVLFKPFVLNLWKIHFDLCPNRSAAHTCTKDTDIHADRSYEYKRHAHRRTCMRIRIRMCMTRVLVFVETAMDI